MFPPGPCFITMRDSSSEESSLQESHEGGEGGASILLYFLLNLPSPGDGGTAIFNFPKLVSPKARFLCVTNTLVRYGKNSFDEEYRE